MTARLSLIVCWIGLLLPGNAAEIMGAEKALARLKTEIDQAGPGNPKEAAAIAFGGHVRDLAGRVSALPPSEAVTKWLALVAEWRGITRPDDDSTPAGNVEFSILFAALPGPDAWDALDTAIKSRPRTGDANEVALNACLRALTATLKGDLWAVDQAMQDFHRVARGAHSSWGDTALDQWLASVRDESPDKLKKFAADLKRSEQQGKEANGIGEVPELIKSVGPVKAEALLKRLLVLQHVDVRSDDAATRRLAAKVAVKLGNKLTGPQWNLVRGTSDEEMALFQWLVRRYPREDLKSMERETAEAAYLTWLVMKDRHDEAVKLATAISNRSSGNGASLGGVLSFALLGLPEDVAVSRRLVPFLRELLSKYPTLHYWEDLSTYSGKAGMYPELVDFLRGMLIRTDLSPAIRELLTNQLAAVLLASDRPEEGGAMLRQMLDRTMATVGSEEEAEGDGINADYALKLAELGRLLNKPEWLDAGISAAHAALVKMGPAVENGRIDKFKEFAITADRPAEAEDLLVTSWIWEVVRELDPDQNGMGDIRPLLSLVDFYSRVGRPLDVYRLLEESPSWYQADLADLIDGPESHGTALAVPAAKALAAVGKKAEARKVLLAFLQRNGGSDPGYAALLELGGDDLGTVFDELFATDRFEERPLIWKARWLLQQGKTDDAEKAARAAIAIDPSDGEQAKGDRLRAYAVLADVLEKKGEAAQATTMRGVVTAIRMSEDADDFWKAGLLNRAVSKYEEALGHFADAYCVQSRLALRYIEQGNAPKAAEHFQRAYELMPDSFGEVESHCFGCEGVFSSPQAQEMAERVFLQLAAAPDAKAQVFYLLGYLRGEQGRNDEALTAYRRAVELDPDYLNAWNAMLHLNVPHADRQVAALNLLRLDPLGRHAGGVNMTGFGEVTDLQRAWPLLAEMARREPKPPGPIMVLKASKEALQSPEGAGGRKLPQGAPASSAIPATPGLEAGGHPALRAIGNMIEITKSGRRTSIGGGC